MPRIVRRAALGTLPSAVAIACQDGDVAAIRAWFATGARDPNERDAAGWTLLLRATRHDHLRVMRVLLAEQGADANVGHVIRACGGAVVETGETPLHVAASLGHDAAAALLLDGGARLEARLANGGKTPLNVTAERGEKNYYTIRLLLERGANLDARDRSGDDVEACARRRLWAPHAADFLADVKAAGGWRAYRRRPRAALLALRHFCHRGAATPPAADPTLARLFADAVPKEVFWLVLSFWRADRDDPPPWAPRRGGAARDDVPDDRTV